MPIYTNKDVRDAKLVKGRVDNLLKLIQSLREKHYDKLTDRDDADLLEVDEILRRIQERYKYR